MFDNITKAIWRINPEAKFIIRGNTIDGIEWRGDTSPIAKADIEVKVAEVEAEYEAQEYARKRKAEYPSIEELVVALYDDEDKAAVDEKRAAVKLKYPKT